MYDFKDISIIIHCRIDNQERGKNSKLVYNFYKSNTINSEFIFVEDDSSSELLNYINLRKNDHYINTGNNDTWHKTVSYNIGAKKSERKYLYFLDLDVIVHPKYICKSLSLKSDLVIGYNGHALYLNYDAKRIFENDPSYERLLSFVPTEWLFEGKLLNHNILAIQNHKTMQTRNPLNRYQYCMAPNNKAVGGCVIADRETFFKYKGFNPNFKGWGYEDNELPTRVHKLGYSVSRINSPNALLFHLPHDPIEGDITKNSHKDNNSNHAEMDKVDQYSKNELKEYIKKWNV